MNPLLVALLSMFIRQAFLALAGALGLAHLVQPIIDQYMTQFQQLSTAAAIAIVTIGYAAYRKFHDRQKLVTALSASSMTENESKELVANNNVRTPSTRTPKDEVPL